MSFTTNAGADDRLSPAERRRAQHDLDQSGVEQDLDSVARAAALRRERPRRELLKLEAQAPMMLDMGDGEQRPFIDAALDFELEERDLDESIDSIWEVSLRPVEDANWPFKPKRARAGIRPQLGPKGWEALLDTGSYCLRCGGRMRQPEAAERCVAHEVDGCEQEHGVGASCFRCGLTPEHRSRALDYLERVAQVYHVAGPSREVRRANRRAPRASGLVLPGQTWTPGGAA